MQKGIVRKKQRAPPERPTFPVNPLLFRVPGLCLAAILDCRTIHGILWVLQVTFLSDCLLEKDDPLLCSTIPRIRHPLLKNWDLIRLEIHRGRRRKWDENPKIRQHLCLASKSGGGLSNHTGGTYSHSGMIQYPRFPISELHLGNFPTFWEFQSWIVNFRTEVCSKSADPHLTMHWIEEVEKATSFDELVTSRSIVVRNDFTDYDMLHTIVASALKRHLVKHVHFRKRVTVEEHRAQTYDRSLRGRHNADMIYEHFRATGAHKPVQGLSDLLRKRLQNDDVQDFERSMGSSSFISKRHALRCDSRRIVKSQNYRTLFSFGPSWLCTIKKPFETMDRQVIYDWRLLWNFIPIRLWELETSDSESEAKLWKEE